MRGGGTGCAAGPRAEDPCGPVRGREGGEGGLVADGAEEGVGLGERLQLRVYGRVHLPQHTRLSYCSSVIEQWRRGYTAASTCRSIPLMSNTAVPPRPPAA